ncbi:MAG: hypothetical protein WCC04_00535 [Terriglobales bacterium]
MPNVFEMTTGVSFEGVHSLQMLWGQPFLELQGTGAGYRLTEVCAARQRSILRSVYAKAIESGTQFCVFPEFSMPLDMVAETNAALNDNRWPTNSIFISGVAPLSVIEFNGLAAAPGTTAPGTPIAVGAAEFVNCVCVWLKNAQGDVKRVLQPKLHPSRPEQATQGMYEGDSVYLFQTNVVSFCCLICFDCISIDLDEFISKGTHNVRDGDSKNLHLVFVLEYNLRPEHVDFISFAERILVPHNPKLNTGIGAAVAFVNTAHKTHGRAVVENFGRSSLCYIRRGSWNPCGADGPLNLVPSTFAMESIGNTLLRVRFREDGAALHTFRYFIPSLLGPNAGETKYPIETARVHKIDSNGTCEAGNIIPALPKVFTDWLTSAITAGDGRFIGANAIVDTAVKTSLVETVDLLQACGSGRMEQFVTLLLGAYVKHNRPGAFNPDTWQPPSNWVPNVHGQAILELASVCALLNLLARPDFINCDHSHTCKLEEVLVTVLDGNNTRNCFDIWSAYAGWLSRVSWGETIGKSNLLLVARAAFMTNGDRATQVSTTYVEPEDSELATLPAGIQPHSESILDTSPRVYWIAATALRTALAQTTVANAQQYLRRALEPARMS